MTDKRGRLGEEGDGDRDRLLQSLSNMYCEI